MARFDVHRNPGRGPPYLVDVQHDLFEHLATRVVIPLVPVHRGASLLRRLNPTFEIEGQLCALSTPEMAGIPTLPLERRRL